MSEFAVIVGTQRSGTTVLRSILGTHPRLTAYGEVFLERHRGMSECFFHYLDTVEYDTTPEGLTELFQGYLDYLERLSGSPDWVLFDCKYQFLRAGLLPEVDKTPLYTYMGDLKMIHIVRKNLLSTYVSCLVSAQTGVWATSEPEKVKNRTVRIPTGGLAKTLDGRWNEIAGFNHRMSSFDTLQVYYEDLFVDGEASQEILEAVADHLGVENEFNPVPHYKKIGLPLNKAIENYDEVCEALEGTQHAWLLD